MAQAKRDGDRERIMFVEKSGLKLKKKDLIPAKNDQEFFLKENLPKISCK